jgi:head-tail adaptor
MTPAGPINRRVQVQTQSSVADAFGQPQQTWTTVRTVWASIDVQGSQLLYNTAEFVSKSVTRIMVRWTSSFVYLPNMRIVYTEATTGVVHVYNIESVTNVKQGNRDVMLLAYELDAGS